MAAVPGTILPYAFFGPLVLENGPNLSLFLSQLFQNRISAFFGMDVLVSAVALWVFVFWEGVASVWETCGSTFCAPCWSACLAGALDNSELLESIRELVDGDRGDHERDPDLQEREN